MDLLNQRILQDGQCLPGGILKVDSFINHQLDPDLMMQLAQEIARTYADRPLNKILTIEASGIAPALFVGYLMHLPVVFIKKAKPSTMDGMFTTTVHSFTKGTDSTVCVSKNFLTATDRVLFIDDFLANGHAAQAAIDLCHQASAHIEAMAFLIEKAFQNGGDYLRAQGIDYTAIATVKSLDNGAIELA